MKTLFKPGDKFWHPEQELFVEIDTVEQIPGKGNLYALKVYNHQNSTEFTPRGPWKRYYEDKIMKKLVPLKKRIGYKVLYEKN